MSGCLQLLLQFPILIVLYWLVVDPIQYVCGGSRDLISVLYGYMNANSDIFGTLKSTNGSIEIFGRLKDIVETQGVGVLEGLKTFCANGEDVYAHAVELCEVPANFFIGDVNFGMTPAFDFTTVNAWLLLIPVLTFVVYFGSMKLNRKLQFQPTQSVDERQQACSNNMMDFTMPLMSVFITFGVPAAIGVYWIFKSILGTVKQFIMSRVMPLPKFTEEDYKAAEKEMYGKNPPKKIVKSERAGTVRSLHHIDDEDYDEKGNYCPKAPSTKEAAAPTEKIAKNDMTLGASLKDESDKASNKND
jgi:YidC/Oxa1 family membrane protein insertase